MTTMISWAGKGTAIAATASAAALRFVKLEAVPYTRLAPVKTPSSGFLMKFEVGALAVTPTTAQHRWPLAFARRGESGEHVDTAASRAWRTGQFGIAEVAHGVITHAHRISCRHGSMQA